ncbi:MAG: T9SS type A sorting domain-containing protein [Candidatus Latescibacteria bacterium]|nr:T9SS type A sorting domain-containing protein [Candidatus Latescibacterota bacterium]
MSKYIVIMICLVSLASSYIPDINNLILFPEHKFIINPEQYNRVADFSRAESSHSYDVRHYQLNLTIPMTSSAYSGLARIKIVPRVANFDTFNLDFASLVCDSVKRAGNNLVFLANNNRLKITLDRAFSIGETCLVEIFYRRNSGLSNLGVYYYPRGTYPAIMYTTTEPYDSRYWFPCFDENWDKAEQGCEIYVTVPDSFTVCSNGLLDSVIANNGWKTFYWSHQYPIITCLMTFTASIYSTWSHWYRPSATDSMEIKYYVWRVDSSRSHTAFQNVLDMMQFFADDNMYGFYPFEKYGMNATYPFVWGGMENQTITMIHRNWLNGNDNGIAHELAHQWWGNMVSCFTWKEIWLNEGFATYSDALYLRHQLGHTQFINTMNSRASYYFQEDLTYRVALYDMPINNLFTWGHTYCKASWVQHMLRYITGDTTNTNGIFFQAMRVYGDSFKYVNASTQDYRRIMEQMTGLNLEWFFNEWIYQAGYPKYYYNWSVEPTTIPEQYRVIVRINQNNGSNAPAVFHMPLQIKFTASGYDTTVLIPIATSPQTDTFFTSFSPSAMTIDPNNWVLKRTYLGIEEVAGANAGKPLYKIYPNPFRGQVKLDYNLSLGQSMEILIYNRAGQMVRNYNLTPKYNNYLIWDGKDNQGRQVSAGVYFVKLKNGHKTYHEKIVKLQ